MQRIISTEFCAIKIILKIDFTKIIQVGGTDGSTMWKSTVESDLAKKFPWNQLFSNFSSNNVDLTKKLLIFP